jgi:hypothetical protein
VSGSWFEMKLASLLVGFPDWVTLAGADWTIDVVFKPVCAAIEETPDSGKLLVLGLWGDGLNSVVVSADEFREATVCVTAPDGMRPDVGIGTGSVPFESGKGADESAALRDIDCWPADGSKNDADAVASLEVVGLVGPAAPVTWPLAIVVEFAKGNGVEFDSVTFKLPVNPVAVVNMGDETRKLVTWAVEMPWPAGPPSAVDAVIKPLVFVGPKPHVAEIVPPAALTLNPEMDVAATNETELLVNEEVWFAGPAVVVIVELLIVTDVAEVMLIPATELRLSSNIDDDAVAWDELLLNGIVTVTTLLVFMVKEPITVEIVMPPTVLIVSSGSDAVEVTENVTLMKAEDWKGDGAGNAEAFCGCRVMVRLPVAGTLVSKPSVETEELLAALVGALLV